MICKSSVAHPTSNTRDFFILPSQLFCSVRSRAPLDENLNETLEAVFQAIEDSAKGSDSEANFSGLFDDIDVNSNKLGGTVAERNKRLVKLMNGVGDMKLGDYRDNTIDAFGDAYEYLMGMYASNAGKSGGEYFTPQEVSELLTRIAVAGKTEVNKVYDCIIQMPDNLFYGTTIATCIMVLKKSKRDNHTLFLDASKQCVKITNSNKLTEDNIQTIPTAYLDRADKPHFAALVPNDKIAEQDYNLSVSTYVEQEDTREVIDIQKLNAEIAQIVAREQKLREEIDKIVAEIEG